jgi:threonine dehydrogenase-like Zn-dependent dehydrogenase
MRAAVLEAPMRVVVREVPRPAEEDGTVIVRVRSCGICGSDLHIFKGTHPRIKPPIILGHEFIGEIVSTPSETQKWSKNQRVTVNPLIGGCGVCAYCKKGDVHLCDKAVTLGINRAGAFAEFIQVPAGNVLPVPEDVSDLQGTLVEPLAVAVSAVRQAGVGVGSVVGVLGCGPIGLLCIGVAKAAGALAIAATDPRAACLQLAPAMGAAGAFDANGSWCQEIKDTFGPLDVTFVAASGGTQVAERVLEGAIDLTRKEGSIFVLSNFSSKVPVDVTRLRRRHQVMTGSTTYGRRDFAVALELMAKKVLNPEALVTHQVAFDSAEQGFVTLLQDPGAIKVVIRFPPV